MLNSKIHTTFINTLAVAMLMCAAFSPPAQAGDQRLTGLWEVVGTPDPVSGIPPFTNLVQFSHDGHMINLDPTEGASIGEWQRAGHNQYTVTFFGFLPMGPDVARFVVYGAVEIEPGHDSLQGTFLTELSLGGLPIFSFSGSITGIRL